jgi:hypothetical protein
MLKGAADKGAALMVARGAMAVMAEEMPSTHAAAVAAAVAAEVMVVVAAAAAAAAAALAVAVAVRSSTCRQQHHGLRVYVNRLCSCSRPWPCHRMTCRSSANVGDSLRQT